MTDFVKRNKIWLGAVFFIPTFLGYVYLSNFYFIPALEDTGLNNFGGGIVRPSIFISIIAILIFQILFLHLGLSVPIQQLIQLNRLKPTIIFLAILIPVVTFFEFPPGTKFEETTPYSPKGIGKIIELILGAYAEEVFFRGFLFMIFYQWMRTRFPRINKRLLAFCFIILNSFIFGISHVYYYSILIEDFRWLSIMPPILLGILFSIIYLNTKNLLLCISFHFLINFLFFTFPLREEFAEGMALGILILAFLILMIVGHVIYKHEKVKYIDD